MSWEFRCSLLACSNQCRLPSQHLTTTRNSRHRWCKTYKNRIREPGENVRFMIEENNIRVTNYSLTKSEVCREISNWSLAVTTNYSLTNSEVCREISNWSLAVLTARQRGQCFETKARCNSGFGLPVDLVPLNYLLADLVPPPKCRFYLNIFNISIVIYIVDFISMISVELINRCV